MLFFCASTRELCIFFFDSFAQFVLFAQFAQNSNKRWSVHLAAVDAHVTSALVSAAFVLYGFTIFTWLE